MKPLTSKCWLVSCKESANQTCAVANQEKIAKKQALEDAAKYFLIKLSPHSGYSGQSMQNIIKSPAKTFILTPRNIERV